MYFHKITHCGSITVKCCACTYSHELTNNTIVLLVHTVKLLYFKWNWQVILYGWSPAWLALNSGYFLYVKITTYFLVWNPIQLCKLETSHTVILAPMVSVLWIRRSFSNCYLIFCNTLSHFHSRLELVWTSQKETVSAAL